MDITHYLITNSLPIILGILIGALVCFILMSLFSPKIKRFKSISKELATTKSELSRQREELVKHFSHSAELLDKMAQDFRHLYQHMADNQNSLLSSENASEHLKLTTQDEQEMNNATPPQLTQITDLNEDEQTENKNQSDSLLDEQEKVKRN